MRHLSTSLPRAAARRRANEPTPDILSDFRAAALSVTNLYKTAAKAQDTARAAGYQDALDDILAFLDKENLGLMDGEGWRVRQWATERLDGDPTAPRQPGAATTTMADEDEDDGSTTKDDDKDDERSSSPETTRKPPVQSSSQLTEDDVVQHRRVVSEPPQLPPDYLPQPPPQSDFTFQSTHAYPTNHERESNADMDVDLNATPVHSAVNSSAPSSTESVRIIPRVTRTNRHNNHNRRNAAGVPTFNLNLGSAAGNKRKMPYPDFFDISGLNDAGDRREPNGSGRGGKRGRHV